MINIARKPFASASRNEIDCQLFAIEGNIPEDMYGHVFFNSPCGTVNSGGLPIPEKYAGSHDINPEYGANLFNGDAMLHRFDLNEKGRVRLKTALLKTPCYYADLATKKGTGYYDEHMQFKMLGIARQSFKFGSRNQLNTALNPFRMPGDKYSRLTASFDMGRPWEVDVQNMKLKTPIGEYKDWHAEFPRVTGYPFQLMQTTAHPAFDPHTNEYFTVNFLKSFMELFFDSKFNKKLVTHHDQLHQQLKDHIAMIESNDHPDKQGSIRKFYRNAHRHIVTGDTWWEKLLKPFWNIVDWFIKKFMELADWYFDRKNALFLLRWDGKKVDSWKVIDADTGQSVVIAQCMHQNNICKDYLILSDSALKFAADIMITNPFPHDMELDRYLRELTAHAQLPETPLYIIKRSDLDPSKPTVEAKRVVIDLETVHFSPNYENPDGQITLHTAHNAASCAAEWIRPYDNLAVSDNGSIYNNTIGLMTCGEMDIGRIGKFVIDAEKGEIVSDQKIHLTGTENVNDPLGAHTWGVALHTYRDIISDTTTVGHINKIYWQAYGTDPRFLTDFIENLYHDYEHRIIPVDEILRKNREKIPFCLLRQDTNEMKIEDAYIFKFNENLRSIQFISRLRDSESPESIDSETDGYIFCTMVNGTDDLNLDQYSREIWIFDAADLSTGPVCKLTHPEMDYAFTIHSVWIENCVSQETAYQVDIRKDIDYAIKKFCKKEDQSYFSEFMEENVYPYFD